MKQQYLVALLVPALLIAACGGKGYDQEIILQLFRNKLAAADKVFVEANGVGQPVKVLELDNRFSFDSCSTNQVRIIPKQQSDGKYPAVHVLVRSGALKAETTVTIPAPKEPVRLVLGPSGDLLPSGQCSAGLVTDGGPLLKKELGEPCTLDVQCRGGVCLRNQLKNSSAGVDFPDGYCSETCSVQCSGGTCQEFKYPGGAVLGSYCLKSCKVCGECPTTKLFCTPGYVCMPCTPGVNCC